MPRIDRITVEGYLSIRAATVELGQLNVLVGANGSGKSNFVSALELLSRIVDQRMAGYIGPRGGASAQLFQGRPLAKAVRLRVEAGRNAYEAELLRGTGDRFVFGAETVSYHNPSYPKPLDIVIGRGHEESMLRDVSDKDHRGRAIAEFVLNQVSGCRVYHFHDTSEKAPVKQYANGADNVTLQSDAGNLAPFLTRMARRSPDDYRRILASVRQVAPFFDDLVLEEEYRDQIRLRWRQDDTVFPADALSDGTLRFLCLSTLLLQPEPPAVIVLDEPELGLHPAALRQLADLLSAASNRTQVVIATQSVTLVDQFSLDDLIVVERQDGASALLRPDREALAAWLTEYSLGDLWQKSVLGGQPSFRGR